MVQDEDIFGQIDALLGKRSSAVLAEKTLQGDDFPMLTEIIHTDSNGLSLDVSPSQMFSHGDDCQQVDRRVSDRRHNISPNTSDIASNLSIETFCDALERKLTDMLRIQHINLERSIRLIIQEEFKRHGSD